MSKRRTRYTLTLANGDRHVVLAYSPSGAMTVLPNAVAVEKGDYRALPRQASGARVLQANLREAVARLGLELPVEVTLSTRAFFQRGVCTTLPSHWRLSYKGGKVYGAQHVMSTAATWTHSIRLQAGMNAKDMGETLWHELGHAFQFERDADVWTGTVAEVLRRWHAAYRDGTAYERKTYEIEANGYMGLNNSLPLAGV